MMKKLCVFIICKAVAPIVGIALAPIAIIGLLSLGLGLVLLSALDLVGKGLDSVTQYLERS